MPKRTPATKGHLRVKEPGWTRGGCRVIRRATVKTVCGTRVKISTTSRTPGNNPLTCAACSVFSDAWLEAGRQDQDIKWNHVMAYNRTHRVPRMSAQTKQYIEARIRAATCIRRDTRRQREEEKRNKAWRRVENRLLQEHAAGKHRVYVSACYRCTFEMRLREESMRKGLPKWRVKR